jgi:hypothetical protein
MKPVSCSCLQIRVASSIFGIIIMHWHQYLQGRPVVRFHVVIEVSQYSHMFRCYHIHHWFAEYQPSISTGATQLLNILQACLIVAFDISLRLAVMGPHLITRGNLQVTSGGMVQITNCYA